MGIESYRSIDVDVFKDILENEYFSCKTNKKEVTELLELVKQTNTIEVKVPGLNIDKKKETAKIKYRRYGFKIKADFAYDYRQDVFENETIISLIPQKIYELEDMIKKCPVPYCEKGKNLSLLLSDTFERLKVKAKYILGNSINDDQITHYAKKNIQTALRNCYDSRMYLMKIQKTKNKDAIFLAIMANAFMLNVLTYLTKMFSSYYTEKTHDKYKQKAELYDVMDLNVIMEPETEYKVKPKIQEVDDETDIPRIIWNKKTNQLLTAIYDLYHLKDEENNPLIEIDMKDLQDLVQKIFLDKNGKTLNKLTIKTCLSESREDKRTQGNKRIDVKKYFES
ncbi:MAG: hypothetical protein PHW82_10675 [Bacteroidales bacterium]|nr:hypothetical protein [Bacteroidales bacterium]